MGESTQRHPVGEDHADRTWTPERKCRADMMTEILEIILEFPTTTFRTFEVTERLQEGHPELKYGTCSAYVSASLLSFREAGWVRFIGRDGKTYLWEVDA